MTNFANARKGGDVNVQPMHLPRTRKSASAFTLIELLVVISIIAIRATIALPVFNNIQERARATADLNNLRQIGIATQTYLNDHDGVFFVPTANWLTTVQSKYLSSWKIFLSPFDRRASTENASAPISYGFKSNARVTAGALSTDQISKPSEFILFAPVQPFTNKADTPPCVVTKDSAGSGGATKGGTHQSGTHINALFADLHVENMLWSVFHSDVALPGDMGSARWHSNPANINL